MESEISITVTKVEPNRVAPIAAYFANGLRDPGSQKLEFSVYAKGPAGRVVQTAVVAEGEQADFIGRSNGVENAGPSSCSYMVGIYNKREGILELVPTQGNKVIRLEPRARSVDYGAALQTGDDPADVELKRLRHKRLVESFGSTRRKRQMNARDDARVQLDKVSSVEGLMGTLASVVDAAQEQGLIREQVLAKATQHRNLPPHHPEATSGPEAYVLKEIVPEAAWPFLEVGRLLSASEKEEVAVKLEALEVVPAYVLSRLPLLRDTGDQEQRKHTSRCLAYMAALLRLYKSRAVLRVDPKQGGIEAVAKRMNVKEELLTSLLSHFYHCRHQGPVVLYELEGPRRDLLLGHLLVAAVLAENCNMAPEQFTMLKEELKLTVPDLTKRFRELGCLCTVRMSRGAEGGAPGFQRSYTVGLLAGDSGKTLQECFPGVKFGGRKK